jgi:hypothetical protein
MPTQPAPRLLAAIALVISIGTVAAFMILLSRPIPIPIPPAAYLGALAVATALAAWAVVRSRRWLPVSALAVSVVLLAFAGYFNFVQARVPAPRPAFVVGQPAPDFTLPDATGRPVRLADYRGQKPVVLIFYRGYW